MDTMKLSIVTPNGEIFNDDIKSVSLPGKEGEFGVLPNHSSFFDINNIYSSLKWYGESHKNLLLPEKLYRLIQKFK